MFVRHHLLYLVLSGFIAFAPITSAESSPPPSEPALGESIYRSVSEAVFLVEVLNEEGNVSSLGSAFLVGDQLLVTNHHVVVSGKPFLRVGSLRLECSVEKTDSVNDLALLRVQASIAAQPLSLTAEEPPAGATVFAIGNPAGLEKTISQGLVSGRRQLQGQSLLQISAAISPGSSGGPVVNRTGEVVGVAVGYLDSGQNLNFAVPSKLVLKLMAEDKNGEDLGSLLERATSLDNELSNVDLDLDKWSELNDKISELMQYALELASGSPEKLLAVAETADQMGRRKGRLG